MFLMSSSFLRRSIASVFIVLSFSGGTSFANDRAGAERVVALSAGLISVPTVPVPKISAQKVSAPKMSMRLIMRKIVPFRRGHNTLAATVAPVPVPVGTRRARSSSSSSRPYLLTAPRAAAPDAIQKAREEVLVLTNRERAKVGAPALTTNLLLQQSAQNFAKDMVKRNYFSHTDPEGRSSLDRIRAAGYLTPPCACAWMYRTGENLGKGQQTPAEIVRDWMASPLHRENLLNPAFKDIGIGHQGGLWVQHFGLVKAD